MFRTMRRHAQLLSEEETAELLKVLPRGVLSLMGDEGYPYGIPMDFVLDGTSLFFHSAKEGHKIDAIKSCDKASFCAINEGVQRENDWSKDFKSVIAFGRVSLVNDPEKKLRALRLLGNKYYPTAQEVEHEIDKDGARCQVIELAIEHMTAKRVHEK